MSLETRRLKLQSDLEEILGSRNVYFQPPSSISMEYPCIVYSYSDYMEVHSDNITYFERDKYSVVLISKDPLPEIELRKLKDMPYSSFERHYSSDNLHHFAYVVYAVERA